MSDVTFTRDYSHIRALRKTYSDVTPTQMTKPAENISYLNTTTKDTVTPPTTNENLPQEQTPPEVPVRGGEYATIRQDQRETLKKTVFIPPPAESKNYHTWVRYYHLHVTLISFSVSRECSRQRISRKTFC